MAHSEDAYVLSPRRLFTGAQWMDGHHVVIQNQHVVDVTKNAPAGLPAQVLDGWLVPGFIDLQVNGGDDVLFNNAPTVEALRRIATAHRALGTTGFLPTFVTDSLDKRRQALQTVQQALREKLPSVLGVHWEGPHLSPKRQGVHDPQFMAAPKTEDLALLESLPGQTLVTLAPEHVPPTTIQQLATRGVKVSLGHSDASYEQAVSALQSGATGFTHLFNVMSPLHHRAPGMVGAALDSDSAWCGIIADGHHTHAAAVRLAYKTKPRGKLFLVSDAAASVGGKKNSFSIYGQTIRVENGRCTNEAGQLAGSAIGMIDAVRFCVQQAQIPLDEALRMAATYPASFMGWTGQRGAIAPGHTADMLLISNSLQVLKTWVGGHA